MGVSRAITNPELPFVGGFQIPEQLGSVNEVYRVERGTGNGERNDENVSRSPFAVSRYDRMVVLIENAHANYGAQVKVRELLRYLDKTYGIKTVFVEGAAEKLDPSSLQFFPEKEKNLKLAEYLAQEGILSGAGLYLAEDPKGVEGLPLEDIKLYRANYEALKKVFSAGTSMDRGLETMEARLGKLSSKTLSPELRKTLEEWQRFEKGRREFLPFTGRLVVQAKEVLHLDMQNAYSQLEWPQMVRLLALQKMEKKIDPAKVREERTRLVRFLKEKRVSEGTILSLEQAFGETPADPKLDLRAVFESFVTDARAKGLLLKDWPSFTAYAAHRTLQQELDAPALFKEIGRLFAGITDSLAKTDQEKALVRLHRDLTLFSKLLHLELSRDECSELLARKISPKRLTDQLNLAQRATANAQRLTNFKTGPSSPNVLIGDQGLDSRFRGNDMEAIHANALAFYSFASQREKVFYDKIDRAMREKGITKAVVVTGGFHTEGMSQILREKGAGFAVVTPHISETSDARLYKDAMLGRRNAVIASREDGEAISAMQHSDPSQFAGASFLDAAQPQQSAGVVTALRGSSYRSDIAAGLTQITGIHDPQRIAAVMSVKQTSDRKSQEVVGISDLRSSSSDLQSGKIRAEVRKDNEKDKKPGSSDKVKNFIKSKITPDKFSIIDDNRNHAAKNILQVLARGQLPVVFPYQIQLDLTQFCPFWDVIQRTGKGFKDCIHCAFPSKTRRQVDPAILTKILKNFEAHGGKSIFVTGGGEPGVYESWHEFFSFLAGSRLGLTMNTNGLFVKKLFKEDPDILRKVFSEEKDPSVISISIHGDYAYKLVTQLNDMRQKLGLNIVIRNTYLVHPDTPISELTEFLEKSQGSGADMVSFKPEHVLKGDQRVFSTNEVAYRFIQNLLYQQAAKDKGMLELAHPYDLVITAMRPNRLKNDFESVRTIYQRQVDTDHDPLCFGPLCNLYLNTELLLGMCCDTKDKGIGGTPAEVFADSLFVQDKPQDYFLAAMLGMIKLNPKHCIVGCGFMEPNFTYPMTLGLKYLTDTLKALRTAWRRGEITEEHIKEHLKQAFIENVKEAGDASNENSARRAEVRSAPLLRSLEGSDARGQALAQIAQYLVSLLNSQPRSEARGTVSEEVRAFDANVQNEIEKIERKLPSADLVVLLPFFNEIPEVAALPGTKGQPIDVRELVKTIGRSLPDVLKQYGLKHALVLCVGETKGKGAMDSLEALTQGIPKDNESVKFEVYGKEGEFTGKGLSGKKWATRLGMKVAERLGAHFVLIDSDMTVDQNWLSRFVEPVLAGRVDYVSPHYARYYSKDDISIIDHLVFPLFSSLFGAPVRMPNAGELVASKDLIEGYLNDDAIWTAAWPYEEQFAVRAVAQGKKTANVWMDEKIHKKAPIEGNLSPYLKAAFDVFAQQMTDHPDWWRSAKETKTRAPLEDSTLPLDQMNRPANELYGDRSSQMGGQNGIDRSAWIKIFKDEYSAVKNWYRDNFPETGSVLEGLLKSSDEEFRFSSRDWAQFVMQFMQGYRIANADSRAVYLSAFIPAFRARVASFIGETEKLTLRQAEQQLRAQAQDFTDAKMVVLENQRMRMRYDDIFSGALVANDFTLERLFANKDHYHDGKPLSGVAAALLFMATKQKDSKLLTNNIHDLVRELTESLRLKSGEVFWTPQTDLHTAIATPNKKFLPELPAQTFDPATVEKIRKTVASAGSFDIRWQGITMGDNGVMILQGFISNPEIIKLRAALAQDFPKSVFPDVFIPNIIHMTLGRFRAPIGADRYRKLLEKVAERRNLEFGTSHVENLNYVRATLKSGQQIGEESYVLLHELRLSTSPRSEMRVDARFSEGKFSSVAITGASGDLGAMLGRYVDSKGHFVRAMVRSDKGKQKYEDRALRGLPNDRFLLLDILDREKMKSIMAESSVFYHLAALVGLGKDSKSFAENFKVNGLAAVGLVKLAEENNPGVRFIFASTQRVCGIEQLPAVNRWIDGVLQMIEENDALFHEKNYEVAIDRLMEIILQKQPFPEDVYPYELGKLLVERYLEKSRLKQFISVRISSLYGPGNLSGRKVQRMIEARLKGQTITEQRETRDYINTQDAVEIMYQLGVREKLPVEHVIDLASGEEVSGEDIWKIIERHTPEADGKIEWKGEPVPANVQSNEIGRNILGRDFAHIETGVRNQIDEIRRRLPSAVKRQGLVLVIDAGGTSTRMGVWDGEKLTDQIKVPTINYVSAEAQGKPIDQMQEIWLEALAQKIREYRARYPHMQSISMGFAGPVGEGGDLTESAVIWGHDRHKISNPELQKKWGLPVKVVNDLTAAVYRYGRSKKFSGMRTIALITVSSGIGSKLFDVVHGEVVIDRQGRAGEIGHTIVDYAGNAISGEGLKGELNAYASGRGLSNLAKRLVEQKKFKVLYERSFLKMDIEKVGQKIESIDRDLLTRLLVEAINKKDDFSMQVMKISITYLVRVVGPFILQNAPDVIVWMGSIAEHLGPVYLDEVIDQLLSKGLYGYTRDDLKKMFAMGENDDENGLRGAGLMVFDKHGEATEKVVHNPGYVRDSVDLRGHEMIEAVAPNDLQQRNYFTEGAFDVENPILADVLEKRNVIFVVEKSVADKVLQPLKQYIRHYRLEKNIKGEIQVLDGGEKIKSDEQVKNLTDYAQDQKLDRNGIFVVVGGGAVMDMVGMVANQFRRGVRYVRIPTTLLAQVDAAVGVKVGIDYRTAKNFLGAFYPPFATITDTRFLETLPERQIQGGIAEIIKVALISNPSLFEILEKYGTNFIRDMPKDEEQAFIKDAAAELLKHLQMDFFEHNLMRHVDFGHVLAHKFESMTNYELSHGEAVAIDILMSSYIARERGLLSGQAFQRILALHGKLKLPFYHPALNPNLAWEGLEEAKAHKGGRLMMVVPIEIGQTTFIDSLRRDELDAALDFLRRHQEQDDEELMIHEINEDHPPVELRYLQQYLESLPSDPIYYLTEISNVLNDLLGPSVQMIINVATNQHLDPGTRAKAAEMLAKYGLHTDRNGKAISLSSMASPNLKNIKFRRHGESFVPDVPIKVQADEAVAQQLLDKEAFVFDIDGTLISRRLDPEIVELIIELLKRNKTVVFATVRGLTLEDYYAHIQKGEGLGILKNIFEHPDFKPEMLSKIFAYTDVASYKYAFRMKPGHFRSGWFNVEPFPDKKFTAKYRQAKIFSEEDAIRLKEIKTSLLEIENRFSKEYGFANPDQDYEGFVRGAKIQEDEKAVLYFPRTKQGEVENWKLRSMLQKLRDRLAEKSPKEFVKGLTFRVVWRKGIVIAKQNNRKNEALLDLEAMGFSRDKLCFFGDDVVADGLDRLVAEIPGLMVISTAAPIPGEISMFQIETETSKSGPDRVKRIMKAYLNLVQRGMIRSEVRLTDSEVKEFLANWVVEGHRFNPDELQPVSRAVFLSEAESLGSANPEWVLRSILGKTSREKISAEEVELFLYQGKVRPVSILYKPRIRPGDIQHSNRFKKGVPVTSSNHPISPVIAESLAAALVAKMRSRIDLSEHARKGLCVLGKYTGSLVLGSLVANLLKLPFVTLTKRSYAFDLPANKEMVKIPEPHMPPENPEYFSYMTLPHNSRVLFVDDEITSGEVVKNTSQALKQNLNADMVGVGVALESSPAARLRLEEMNLPYTSLDQLNEGDLAAADKKNSPTLVPFREAIPLALRTEVKKSEKSSRDINVEFLKMNNGAVFADHPFRGMTLGLDPDLSDQVGERIAGELEEQLGSLSALRKKYYERGRTLFMVGTTPSGILGALPASRVTRLPLIGAMNRPEPKDYDQLNMSDVVNYIGLDGYAYSMFGLTAGDGILLVTGELTDGEEQIRIIQSLKQKGIDVLGVVSLIENTRYSGRERIRQNAGVFVTSLQPYQAKENIPEVNVTDRSWAALKYAVMLLEDEIKKINPEAYLDSIRVLPSSLTGNFMISASDLDEAYIWVDGLSQFQLEQLQPVFNQWLENGGFKFDGHSNKAPLLLSLWHRESNEKIYELHHFPHIEIYRGGQFYSPEALVKSGVLPTRKVQSKNLARLKWFYSLNEIGVEFLKDLLVLAVKSGKWPQGRIKVLSDLIDNLAKERLSAAALECLRWIDREYLAGTRDLAIPQEKSEVFQAALQELVQKGIFRIYGNKILLVTRHGTVVYSDRFWKDQMRILGHDDFLKFVEARWRMSTPEYRMMAEQYSAAIIKKWDRETPRLLPELVMRSWIDRMAPLTDEEKERWFESFECDDALIFAAAIEAGERREVELKEFLKRKVLAILNLPAEKNGSLHSYSGHLQVQLHLSLNMMFRWMRQHKGVIDDDILFIMDAIINGPKDIRIPSMILQDLTVYFAGVYEQIMDNGLKQRVYRFIRDEKGSFKYRSNQLGSKAFKTIIEKSPEDAALVSSQSFRMIAPEAVQNEERKKIFHAIERKRKNGQPIEFLASDWDGSLVAFSSGQESRLSPEMAFWLNWLMSKGKQIVITTAASYSRFYRQTMDPSSNPVPLVKSKNFNVFNDTVAYLNDRPVSLREFTPSFLKQLHAVMEKMKWHFLDDGRPPQLAFWHETLSREEAVRESEAIKSLLPQGNNFYLTLSKFRKNEWIIKLYYETKELIYQTPLANGEKIQPGRSLVMGDDAGPMGNDEPLFRGAADGLKIALGEENISGAMTMQTKNKEGALLAIEAWVASILIDEASQELLPLGEKLQELVVMIDGTPGLGPEVSERMKKNIGGLLARVRSEMRADESGELTEEDLIRKAVIENPNAVLPSPVYFLELHPTNQCNLRCKDCIAGKRDHAFVFPFDQLKNVGTLKPSEVLVIGGGEPTIYRDGQHNFNDYILKLAAVAPQANIGLGTNGVYVPKGDWTKKIKWVSISLHGTSQDRFLGFTGRDKFDQVWHNIFQEYALKSPIEEIKISFVYTKENLKEVLPLLEKIRSAWTAVEAELAKKGIKKRFWFYLQAEAVDHGPDRPFAILNLDDESKRMWADAVEKMRIENPPLWAFIQEHCPWISGGPLKERKSEPAKLCYMVTNYLLIAASGLIYPCCVMPASAPRTNLGHITQSLEELLRRRMKFMFALPKRCRIGCHIGNTLSGQTVKRLLLEPANAANPDLKIKNAQATNGVQVSATISSNTKQVGQIQPTVNERENRSEMRANAVDLAQQNKDLIDRLFYAKGVLAAEGARVEMAKRGLILLEQFPIEDKQVMGAVFRMRVREVLGSRILLAVKVPSVERAAYYSYAFGNVDLLVLPAGPKPVEQRMANAVLDESMVKRLPPSVFPKIFRYLDFGQRLNLQTLNFILDYPWNASSPDVYERELAQLRKYRNEAPLGRLITNREMFPTDRDGNLYALHITSGKSAILTSANKEMHTTPHAVGPVIYATPLIRNGLKPLSESAKPVSLAEDVWKNLSARREIAHDENIDNYGLVIRVPYQSASANRLTNWVDYFGFGRAELETYYRFRARPEWTPVMDSIIQKEVARQYNSSHEFLKKILGSRSVDVQRDWPAFWGAFKEARGNMPILNHAFFEILKSYILLFQNDQQSFAMRDEGNMNVGLQYKVLFEVDPNQRMHFSTQRFTPEIDALLIALAKHIRSFSSDHFKAYVMERFPMFIAIKFLEGETLSGPVDQFDDLAVRLPNIAGLLHYNVAYDKLLETSSDLKYEYQLVFSQVLRDIFRKRRIFVPIFGMMVPTGELGVWQMGDEDIKIFDLYFDLPKQISPLTIGKSLDIHIARNKTIRDEERGLSYKRPVRDESTAAHSEESDKRDRKEHGKRSEIRTVTELLTDRYASVVGLEVEVGQLDEARLSSVTLTALVHGGIFNIGISSAKIEAAIREVQAAMAGDLWSGNLKRLQKVMASRPDSIFKPSDAQGGLIVPLKGLPASDQIARDVFAMITNTGVRKTYVLEDVSEAAWRSLLEPFAATKDLRGESVLDRLKIVPAKKGDLMKVVSSYGTGMAHLLEMDPQDIVVLFEGAGAVPARERMAQTMIVSDLGGRENLGPARDYLAMWASMMNVRMDNDAWTLLNQKVANALKKKDGFFKMDRDALAGLAEILSQIFVQERVTSTAA